MTEWLPTLQTETPADGYELAIKLARVAVKKTQPDADALIAVSHVVAVNFATIAAANDYWRTS